MRLLLVLLLALSACGRTAAPVPCPGELQAQLLLTATLVEGEECRAATGAEAAPQRLATISFTGADGAAVCLSRPLAEPIVGTRSGDAIAVAAPAERAGASGCACAVQLVERVTGTLVRDAAGTPVGFTGELVDEVTAADGGACAATAGATCAVPCRMRWTLAGAP